MNVTAGASLSTVGRIDLLVQWPTNMILMYGAFLLYPFINLLVEANVNKMYKLTLKALRNIGVKPICEAY